MKPLCFVIMPFGRKLDAAGKAFEFDAIYETLLAPAIADAEMEPLRADAERVGGLIHKPMFERIVLCRFAVVDLTTGNPNVYYELGVRHAVRPASTVALFAEGTRLPFDLAPLRAIPYATGEDGKPAKIERDRAALAKTLRAARADAVDSPLFQLLNDMAPPDVSRLKTDVFRDRVEYSAQAKRSFAEARKQGIEALREAKRSLGAVADLESGVVIDLFLSLRDAKAWSDMIALVAEMDPALAASVLVREQLALALNRDGRGDEAEAVLLDLLRERGPSSETLGILGRVYKDRWEAAKKSGDAAAARAQLKRAIDAYVRGFEADPRDAYPGVNAVTLMELAEPPDPRRLELLPVVSYAVRRRIAAGQPDYWDSATRLELAVLAEDEAAAREALGECIVRVRAPWEAETTLRNLRLIRETREARGRSAPWLPEIEKELRR